MEYMQSLVLTDGIYSMQMHAKLSDSSPRAQSRAHT